MALNTAQAVLSAFVKRIQELEDAIFTLITPLSDPTLNSITGDLLDKVGSRVGESRGGRVDVDYRAAIRIRIRVNRSRGRAEDVLQVAILASINSTPTYTEYYPASFLVTCQNLPGAGQVAALLGRTKAAGTYGVLASTGDATPGLVWGDSTGALAANNKWGDSVSATGPKWMNGLVTPKPAGA